MESDMSESSERIARTIAFYEQKAREFADRTCGFDMADLYEPFLEFVPHGGHILDAGCGPGRDARQFLRLGYEVTAIDASAVMVALWFRAAFDGVWASASLLHVPKRGIGDVLARLARALRTNGVLYASFKLGEEERFDGERLFNDYTPESVAGLFDIRPEFERIRAWFTENRQDPELPGWVNVLARHR
jgi:SAM-dependent methyltransferase